MAILSLTTQTHNPVRSNLDINLPAELDFVVRGSVLVQLEPLLAIPVPVNQRRMNINNTIRLSHKMLVQLDQITHFAQLAFPKIH